MDGLEQWIEQVNSAVHSFVWGPVMICILVGAGIWFTIGTRFFQVRKIGAICGTLGSVFKRKKDRDAGAISPFQAVSAARERSAGATSWAWPPPLPSAARARCSGCGCPPFLG